MSGERSVQRAMRVLCARIQGSKMVRELVGRLVELAIGEGAWPCALHDGRGRGRAGRLSFKQTMRECFTRDRSARLLAEQAGSATLASAQGSDWRSD